jgi:hypothetical protein
MLPAPTQDSPTKGAKRRAKVRARVEKQKEDESLRMLEIGTQGSGSECEKLKVCLKCRELSDDKKCVRWYEVHKHPDAAKFIGAAMTCVPPEDRLKPLPPVCVFLSPSFF